MEITGLNSHIHLRMFIVKASKYIVIFSLYSLATAMCRAGIDNTETNDLSAIQALCMQKWEWGNTTQRFGMPTVRVFELKGLDSVIPLNVKTYTVKVLNREAIYRKPLVFTYACAVVNKKTIFIENDKDAISLFKTNLYSVDISHVMKILDAFITLRGYKIQVGVPSETNSWVFKPDYGPYCEIFHDEHKKTKSWTFLIGRQDNRWNIECALVSIDDFTTYRYRIVIPLIGEPTFTRQSLIYAPPPSI